MPVKLEEKARKLLEAPNFAYVGTTGKDGRPQVNPIWVDVEDDMVIVNSAEGRRWPRNVREDPNVTLCVPNKDNPYEYVTIWGKVVDDTHEGADRNIDELAMKYMDVEEYPFRQPGEQRIIFRIEPEKVHVYGG